MASGYQYCSSLLSCFCGRDAEADLDVSSVVSVLTRQMLHDSVQTRITALHWIYHLYVNLPSKVNHRASTGNET